MKQKIILYIAMSEDGFIATLDFSVAWLDKYHKSGEDFGYKEFFASIDTVIVGNTTQEQFPQNYEGKPTFVFSKREREAKENITYVNETPKGFMIKYKPKGNIWLLGGANIIGQFLKEDLIDEFIIFIMPDKLDKGISLFRDKNTLKNLEFVGKKMYGNVAEMRYKKK